MVNVREFRNDFECFSCDWSNNNLYFYKYDKYKYVLKAILLWHPGSLFQCFNMFLVAYLFSVIHKIFYWDSKFLFLLFRVLLKRPGAFWVYDIRRFVISVTHGLSGKSSTGDELWYEKLCNVVSSNPDGRRPRVKGAEGSNAFIPES